MTLSDFSPLASIAALVLSLFTLWFTLFRRGTETGVATNHHFNPIDAETLFLFSGGAYSLELVAKLVGSARHLSLWSIQLDLPAKAHAASVEKEAAVYYSWSPEQGRYIGSIESRVDAAHAFSDPMV